MHSALIKHIVSLLIIITTTFGCKQENAPDSAAPPTPLKLKVPANFPPPNMQSGNTITAEGVLLGKMLYYEPLLDGKGNRSCADCHHQNLAFSTPGNILPHINLAWQRYFLWNGKINGTLEDAMMFEVEEFFGSDLSRISGIPKYKNAFEKAFGKNSINTSNAAKAMAQFTATLISADSKYDRVMQKRDAFNAEEQTGYEVFFSEKGDCFHCHMPPLFTDNIFHNIGLDSVYNQHNAGYYEVSGKPGDAGSFKTPTLRNVAVTAGYMHDARFITLDEVIEHYNSGVHLNANTDPLMTKNNASGKLMLTQKEKEGLKAFLLTLTDTTFINNPDFNKP